MSEPIEGKVAQILNEGSSPSSGNKAVIAIVALNAASVAKSMDLSDVRSTFRVGP